VIVRERMKGHADLLQIIAAIGAFGLKLGFAECRKQQRGEDANYGDNDQ
jgi:hypothetical protein